MSNEFILFCGCIYGYIWRFLSATVDNEFEKCGAVKVSSQLIYGSLLWPELLVVGILIDSDKVIKSTCDK